MAKFRSTEPITRENWSGRALNFIKITSPDKLPTIKPGEPGWSAWRQYFLRHLGVYPWRMREVEKGRADDGMTVPTINPEDFDATFEGYDPTLPDMLVRREDPSQKRIALCHAWIRAYESGDPKALERLLRFTSQELNLARQMSLTAACELMPGIKKRLTKKIEEYPPLFNFPLPVQAPPPAPKAGEKNAWVQANEMNVAVMQKEEETQL